ncbi:hypothetical protein BH09BAC3_BH09BAC3_32220 [soil metagenome]
MNRYVLLLFTFLSYSSLQAQELKFTTEWGEQLRAPRNSSLDDIIGYDASGIYTIKKRGKSSYTLEHYDKKFSLTGSFDLDIEEEGYQCTVQSLLQLKGNIYMIYSYANNQQKKRKLLVTMIDKKTLRPSGEKKKVGEIDFSGNPRYNSGYFDIRVSRDSSKVLVQYGLPLKTNEPQQFGFNVLDNQFASLWEKSVTLPYKESLFDIVLTRVDNQGNVYLLGRIYKEKHKEKRRGIPNYSYEVFACRNKGNSTAQYPVILEDRFITDMQIEILDNTNIICAGFYSAQGTTSIAGTYFLTIDAESKAVKTKSFKEFGIDFITENLKEVQVNRAIRKEKKGKDTELFEYDLDKLLVGKDGSAILIGEQYYVETTTSTSYSSGGSNMRSITYHYYYNDIIAVKINPEGQIEWTQKVAKTQHTSDDDGFYSSYSLAIVKGKICFIFNDNPENLARKDTDVGRPENFRVGKSVVVIVSLDQNGKETKQPVFSSADVDVITRPKVCEQISNNTVILFGQRKKEQQFAKITFQ